MLEPGCSPTGTPSSEKVQTASRTEQAEPPMASPSPTSGSVPYQTSIAGDEPQSADRTTFPDPHSSVQQTIPKPVTVEDAPEDESAPATQGAESAYPQDAHLTPRPMVRSTFTPIVAAEASEETVLSSPDIEVAETKSELAVNTVDEKESQPESEPSVIQPWRQDTTPADVPLPPPTALSFLDADSPPVTKEAIRQSTLNAVRRSRPVVYNASPSAYSHSSVGSAAYPSDVFSRTNATGGTSTTWIPGESFSQHMDGHPPLDQHLPTDFHRAWPGPNPRMPGPAMSHIGNSTTQPMFSPPSPFRFVDHVPLSGYQLLASKLAGDTGGPAVKPIYRRFEALNHRLLLFLQDEIVALEEQLQSIDIADTQNRTYPGGIYPASRRQEAIHNGELYWRKSEILAKIGHKLWQYNKLLVSFRDTAYLPAPTMHDLQNYRSFLDHGNYIANEETFFLGATNDLITLDDTMLHGTNDDSEGLMTPMPRSATEHEFPIQLKSAADGDRAKGPIRTVFEQPRIFLPPTALARLALAMFVAILVPVFTFTIIPDFSARVTVVVLVASGVLTTLVQSNLLGLLIEDKGALVLIFFVVVYGGVMAVTALTLR